MSNVYTHKHTDGTRVRVYESRDDVADKYTAVLRSSDWDASAAPGMLAMIGMSGSPTHPQGISQFCSGQEGPHLGRKLQWGEVPEHIRAHIVARISA